MTEKKQLHAHPVHGELRIQLNANCDVATQTTGQLYQWTAVWRNIRLQFLRG